MEDEEAAGKVELAARLASGKLAEEDWFRLPLAALALAFELVPATFPGNSESSVFLSL